MLQLTVDLSADKGTLLRVAQLILQFAGYEPPKEQQGAAWGDTSTTPPRREPVHIEVTGDKAELVSNVEHMVVTPEHDETAADPAQVFATQVPPSPMEHIEARLDSMFPPEPPASFPPPPPPAQASIPDLPPVPPPPPAAGIDVDSRGLPWDPRIHSGTRAKTVNGEWRQKRGTQPMDVARVEAELRQTMGASAPPIYPVTPIPGGPSYPSVPTPPVVPHIPDSYTSSHAEARAAALPLTVPVPPAPFAGNAAPPAPPISSTPPVPASAGAATGASPGDQPLVAPTYVQLVQAISKGITGKTLTKDKVDAALVKFGLPGLPLLYNRPDLVGAVATELGVAL